MTQTEPFSVVFRGKRACFSRPEFKVERVSYPVMTPSAARGALEAIFWKPEIRWEIRAIDVLEPIKQQSILRNEVADAQSHRQESFFVGDRRQQRSSLVLRDVGYQVHAEMVLEAHATDPIPKYTNQFERRLHRGQCFQQPYLGTREFVASFEPPTREEDPIELDMDIGTMLFDIARIPDDERSEMSFIRHGKDGRHQASGFTRPIFFEARIENGRLDVPTQLYDQLRELEVS